MKEIRNQTNEAYDQNQFPQIRASRLREMNMNKYLLDGMNKSDHK